MKQLLWVLLATVASVGWVGSQNTEPAAKFDHSHATWTEVLAEHVKGDRFDYAALKKGRAKLDRYLEQLRTVKAAELAGWSREQRYAFWINAYNAHCIALVVGEYPVKSIKDIGSWFTPVWKKSFIELNDLHPSGKRKKLSLDEIEHSILRPTFKDARVHAAINCASVSCPPLRNEAFVAERLEEQLDDSARKWLADSTRNRFDAETKRAQLSALFQWFEDDFAREGGVRAWCARFAPAEHAEWLRGDGKIEIDYLDYSWKLNDVAR